MATLPWPLLQRSWGKGPTLHPFSSSVVVRLDSHRRLALAETWLPEPSMPAAGASYAPSRRIVPLERRVRARALLVPPPLLR